MPALLTATSNRPKPRDGLFDKVAHVVFVTHVRQNECSFSAKTMKFVFECLALGLAPAGYNDRCAFFGEGKRRGTTDASQSACDEYNRIVHRRCAFMEWSGHAERIQLAV